MESGCQDISMVTTRGQDNFERGASSSQGGNQVEQLASLIQNILEQRMRQENQPNPPPPPPQQKKDTGESAGERFRKLQPLTFDGGIDPIEAEQWIRTTERMLAYAKRKMSWMRKRLREKDWLGKCKGVSDPVFKEIEEDRLKFNVLKI
ncbi:hypothetical protein PanWU01x14_333640 [Parasponia andersonii]|uniref:Uncharacterized protein n=1 Tax=Parasponia andersonii TaxID=3476 RepID=A0A2P5AGU9_PARAD|nr:hypothetical protein PanWU01x14_333640 [Parasponia andersonii]